MYASVFYGSFVWFDSKKTLITMDFFEDEIDYRAVFKELRRIQQKYEDANHRLSINGEPMHLGYVDYYAGNWRALLDPGQGSLELTLAVVGGTLTGIYVAALVFKPKVERPSKKNLELVELVIAAPTREELVARTKALDYVLLSHNYSFALRSA